MSHKIKGVYNSVEANDVVMQLMNNVSVRVCVCEYVSTQPKQ